MGKKLIQILSGVAGSSLLSLLRNLLIATLLPVEQYAIATTFMILVSMIETLSYLGMQQQIVQSKQGADPGFQAGLQGFNLMRGLVAAMILFAGAGWIAALLGLPEVAWAYQVMALWPFLIGLGHFDQYRFKRDMRFAPEAIILIAPVALSLLVVYPAFLWLGDYRTFLVALMVQAVAACVLSHVLAERPFRISFNKAVIRGAIRYGWPLLINNVVMFVTTSGDRVIVTRELGLEDLAIFAMGLTLTLTPMLVIERTVASFFLPKLSAAQDDLTAFSTQHRYLVEMLFFAVATVLALLAVVLPSFVHLVLGDKFAALLPFLPWLALLQMTRALKVVGGVPSMASGVTSSLMIANLVRAMKLPVAWYVAVETGSLLSVIWVATIGEALAVMTLVGLVRVRLGIRLRPLLRPFAGFLLSCLASVGYGLMMWSEGPPDAGLALPHAGGVLAIVVALGAGLALMPNVTGQLRQLVMRARAG